MNGALEILARFLLIPLIGWGVYKLALISENGRHKISFLLLNILYPVMIFANVWQTDFVKLWTQSAFTVMLSIGMTILLFAIGQVVFRHKGFSNPALWTFMLSISNVAYIGIPILDMFFAPETVTLGIVYSSVGDFFIWLLFYPLVLAGSKRPIHQVILNPCLIALVFSFILSVLQVPVLPFLRPVLQAATTIVSIAALFYVGLVLAGASVTEMMRSALPWKFSFMKVVLLPVTCFFIFLPFLGAENAAVMAILAGSPVPLMTLVWAKDDPCSQKHAINNVVISTLMFLVLVVPLCVVFLAL